MRAATLILLLLPAACGSGDEGNEAVEPEPRRSVQTANPTGLYEGPGDGGRRSRMCMISSASGSISFGVVALTLGGGACSGAGEAERQGAILRLRMAGDEECVIEARMNGTRLDFPESLGAGCAYYCSPQASLAGQTFEKTGGTAEAARTATDLVGDPLCD